MIVAAAIRRNLDGMIYSLPAPARHHDIIRYTKDLTGEPTSSRDTQGFIAVDHRGVRFVGRIEARDIALHVAKQITTASHPTELFSEDLW